MARKKSQTSAVRRFHRSFGAGAAVFVMFMVLSGLALNHTDGLSLDERHVSQSYLLGWYGLGEPEDIRNFAAGSDWISFAGSQLYLNGNHASIAANGVGAVSSGEMLIAACSEELLLLNRDGELIERLPWGPPGAGPVESIGMLENGTVAVRTSNQLWLADEQLLKWQPSMDTSIIVSWSSPEHAPEVLRQSILQQYRGEGLSLERLLLDFHSGRIFGPVGVFIYDLLAVAVGFLAISGLVFWMRGRRNGKRNGKSEGSGDILGTPSATENPDDHEARKMAVLD